MLRCIVALIQINPSLGSPKIMAGVVVFMVHPNVRHGFVHSRTWLKQHLEEQQTTVLDNTNISSQLSG
jgi:hypothetical protein